MPKTAMISRLFSRGLRQSVPRSQKTVPITCHGRSIGRDEVFRYTNGRFLINEKHQYEKRYIRFDIDKLCELVSSVVGDGDSPVLKIEKMEGGFHKALLMTLENGSEVIAKIPCPNAGIPARSTASEAAVLEYVRSRTTIPVPKVLAWSSDSTNPVGAEYIIMEKAIGVQLYKVWGDLDESGRLKLIQNLTLLEHQLFSIRFPAYGNLYFRKSVPDASCIPLGEDIDPSGSYCIGPASDNPWLGYQSTKNKQSIDDLGPWTQLDAFTQAQVRRSIWKSSVNRDEEISPNNPPYFGDHDNHKSVLGSTLNALPMVSDHRMLVESSAPLLWHTDLHMGNIFVEQQDPTTIVSVIDWHSTQISPMFLQSRWPVFLEPPENYVRGLTLPKLPSNFDQMDPEEKELAIETRKQASRAKAYEISTARYSSGLYDALHIPPILKELFVRCGDTFNDGIVPLRSCLVRLFRDWNEIGFSGPCPLVFTEQEILQHDKERIEYDNWYTLQETAKSALDTDVEGWISPEVDWDKKQRQNKQLQDLFIKKMAAERTVAQAKQMWPFPANT